MLKESDIRLIQTKVKSEKKKEQWTDKERQTDRLDEQTDRENEASREHDTRVQTMFLRSGRSHSGFDYISYWLISTNRSAIDISNLI
jgi:hypothetical protein